MQGDSSDLFQFASDIDGDLHLFPRSLSDPDYPSRWHVWVIRDDGTRSEAPLCTPMMCVNNGVVSNPLGQSGLQTLAGWYVDSVNASEIEVTIRIPHPRS